MNAIGHAPSPVAAAPRRRFVWTGLALVAAVLLAAALGGCAAKPNTVDIHDLQFDPQTVTVPIGTTVTWTAHDETAHIIQTDDFQVQGKDQTDQFASQPLSPGDSYSYTFSAAGTVTYSDPLQGYMTGTIVVK